MSKRNILLRTLVAIVISFGLIACSGGSLFQQSPEGQHLQNQQTVAPPAQPEQVNGNDPDSPDEMRVANVLSIETPVLSGMTVGTEFDVTLSAKLTQEVHQGSFRLLFDPAVMQPVTATRGELLQSEMIHLCGLDQAGFVPFSFTALPGEPSIEVSEGELLRVRFRLLTQPASSPRVRLQTDVEYLQLRDNTGRRLLLDLETSATGVGR